MSPPWPRRALLALAVLASASSAPAQPRSFTQTHEYLTTPRGETELELLTAQRQATFDEDSPEVFELQLAIEHGITDRWGVALLHRFAQSTGSGTLADPGEPFRFTETRLRSRYRFAERGELPFDLVAHVEAAKRFGGSVYELELRPVLARDLGVVSVAVDPIVAIVIGRDVPEPEIAVGWAAGITYDARPTLRVGAETWGGFDVAHAEETAASAGPAISWSPTPSFWIAATAGFGLNDNADRLSVRGLIGLQL